MYRSFLIFCLIFSFFLLTAENFDYPVERKPGESKDHQINNNRGLNVTPIGASLTVDDVLNTLLGDDVAVTNVQYTGADIASGVYTGGASAGITIDEGIILSCGYAANAVGPNMSSGTTGNNFLPGDPDLDALIPGYSTNDASILEFDFVPEFNSITFQYVFGSEEYPEWVGSAFNDVFGFFLDGVNIALIPGTSIAVSINNVNDHTNQEYYINNHALMGTYNIECDGFTTVLSVSAYVTPGTSHHIRLGIADAGDHILDSWVFIEAESFKSIPLEPPFNVFVQGGQQQYTNEEQSLDIVVTATGPNNSFFNWWLMNPIWGSAQFVQGRDIDFTRIIRYTPPIDYCNAPDIFGFIVWDNWGHSVEIPISVYVAPVNDPPVNVVPPLITGDFEVGGTAFLDPGEWNDDKDNAWVQPGYETEITLSYQWQMGFENSDMQWEDIPGAVELSFDIPNELAGFHLRCMVTALDNGIGNDGESSEMPSNEEYIPELTDSEEDQIPGTSFTAIYPNPFNPTTNIQLSVNKNDYYSLNIYDIKGRKVNELFTGELAVGQHSFIWNGRDGNDQSVASGLYFCILRSDKIKITEKLMLIK